MPVSWFTLEAIRELLSIRIDPEHHTCQESKGIVQARLSEVEARIKATNNAPFLQRSMMPAGKHHSSVYFYSRGP
jgi:MerR family Zn(II)-responsive transcriptional regulator of zntA